MEESVGGSLKSDKFAYRRIILLLPLFPNNAIKLMFNVEVREDSSVAIILL
jgi:hypothetical protein